MCDKTTVQVNDKRLVVRAKERLQGLRRNV